MASEAYQRFKSSMVMDFDKWHDGIGYDLAALRELEGEELAEVRKLLIGRKGEDWRDVEALEALGGGESVSALKENLRSRDLHIKLKAAQSLHAMGELDNIDNVIADVLPKAGDGPDFTLALLLAQQHPTDRVKKALLHSARKSPEHVNRVHSAGLLFYLAGIGKEAFDWDHRPFFLRFNATGTELEEAYRELCERIGVRS
jgi:hypothetical protein